MVRFMGLLLVVMMTVGCGGSSEPSDGVTEGNRLLGIDLLDHAGTETFYGNVARANDIGIDFIALHRNWDQLQGDNGSIDIAADAVKALYDVAVENGWKMSLTIRPIDLVGKSVPSYLDNESFAGAAIQDNFTRTLDELFTHIDPDNLTALFIGNEIDGYDTLSEPASFWSDYGFFLDNMTRYIHDTISPELKVGFTATYHGLTDASPLSLNGLGVFQSFASVVDVVGFTYYPIGGAFEVNDPLTLQSDMEAIVTAYPDTEFMMQEAGCPSGDNNTSSEATQETFFRDLFAAWDVYADNITSMNIVRLVDHSHENAINAAAPYGLETNEAFVSYLETLGLVTFGATAKSAYTAVKEEAAARGW